MLLSKAPQMEWFKQKFAVSQFWRVVVQDQGSSSWFLLRAVRNKLFPTHPLSCWLSVIVGNLWCFLTCGNITQLSECLLSPLHGLSLCVHARVQNSPFHNSTGHNGLGPTKKASSQLITPATKKFSNKATFLILGLMNLGWLGGNPIQPIIDGLKILIKGILCK